VDDLLQEMIRLSYDESGGSIDTGSPCLAAGAPPKLVVSELPNQIDTLEQLYHQKKWKSLTKKALGMLQQPCNDSRRTLEIKAWWLAGLVKEGQNENAKSVVEQISTQIEELETNVWNGKDTSFLYMRLRLLEAIVYCKNCTTTNDLHEKKLFVLISKLSKAIVDHKNSSNIYSKWLRIAQFTLVNHLIHENKFALALRVCSSIQIPNDPHQKLLFASRFGRIYLQMGDLLMAEKFFQEAKTLGASSGSLRLLLNDGLLLFAQNKLQDALNVFYQILHQSFHQSSQVTSGQQEKEEEEEDIVNVAVNNYAICALYCCDVRGAVNTLEQMIRSDPLRHLNGILVFNLSSLYDLIYDNTNSTNRKEMIKKIAEMYDVEHIDPTCFRV
jgi:tetratricopeptide (TPR) repeat protein